MIIAIVFALVALLAAITVVSDRAIARAYPPSGRFIDVNGNRLHIAELDARTEPAAGDPPVVLLHGASGNLEDMRIALGDHLARRHRVVLLDRPGHGWSGPSPGSGSPARQAAIVGDLLDHLGVDRAIIVAHSFAGTIATALALDAPERVAGLVLIAPGLDPWSTGISRYYNAAAAPFLGPLFTWTVALPAGVALMKRMVALVFAPQDMPTGYTRRASIPHILRPRNFLANARAVAGLHAFVTAQAPRYASITAPTVIITGDRDTVVSPKVHAQALAATLPHSKLILLEGVGHMPHHVATGTVVAAVEQLTGAARKPGWSVAPVSAP